MRDMHGAWLVALVTIALAAVAAVDIGAQDRVLIRVWDLQPHGATIPEALEAIKQRVEHGFLPVGLEYEPGKPITVVYTQNISAPISEIAIVTIEHLDELESRMAELLQSGATPMGMARHDGGLTLLTVRSAIPIQNWGLLTVPLNLQSIAQVIRDQEERGFSAWALSDYRDQAWILFMRESDAAPRRYATVQSYLLDADNYIPGIDAAVSNRLIPWGFTITEGEIFVQYTRTHTVP